MNGQRILNYLWNTLKDTGNLYPHNGLTRSFPGIIRNTTVILYGKFLAPNILINNSELGKISKELRTSELEVWKTSLHNSNFADFANNCGAMGIRVKKREELEDAMQKINDHDGPALLDVVCDVTLI